jgi:hypothetical protein
MAGCDFGFSCSCELIVSSKDPLDPKSTISPDELAEAIMTRLEGMTFTVAGTGTHRIVEANVYRVAPTLSSIRRALGQPTPWIGRDGSRKKAQRRKTVRRGKPKR